MRVLELFSGTGTIARAFEEAGASVLTIDNNPKMRPDVVLDVLALSPAAFKRKYGRFDVVWASVPCTCFSVVAARWHHFDKQHRPLTEKADLGLRLLRHTLAIIRELDPTFYFIENPRGQMRKMPEMRGRKRHTVTYCQYGGQFMKPTDVWTNCRAWVPRPRCHYGASCHVPVRGEKGTGKGLCSLPKGSILRAKVPDELAAEIAAACVVGLKGKNKLLEVVLDA